MDARDDERGHEYFIAGMSPAMVAMLKKVAEESAKRTMVDMLLMIGVDITDPIKAQDSFAALRKLSEGIDDEEVIADRLWVRRSRKRSEGMFGKVVATLIGLGVVGAVSFLWDGLRLALKKFGAG